ncbi:MAG: DNA polymerase III subunit epsilon [Halothiobacillus sp.]|nr:DNA polymerase III subunit epsilon [Halothiobacillus sp.]
MTERQIVLDTETTGMPVADGHRLVEIGAVEMIERRVTGRTFHCYLNPERPVDEGAFNVHGLSDAFLADKPKFADVVDEFLAFIEGAELIIHNAEFDVGFIDAELARLANGGRLADVAGSVTDSLAIARKKHPGRPPLRVITANDEERAAHESWLMTLGKEGEPAPWPS